MKSDDDRQMGLDFNRPQPARQFVEEHQHTMREARERTIDARFVEFHEQNPKVYETLVRLARQAHRKGRTKVGMKMLFEVIRWETFLETNDPDFKLNNDFSSRYARLVMRQESDLANVFETRELRTV